MKRWLAVILAMVMVLALSAGYADYGVCVEYTTKAREGEEIGVPERLWDTMEIILKRLESAGIKGSHLEQIGSDGIRVEIPYENNLENVDFKDVLDLIGAAGKLEFVDPDGNVFMTGDMVESAEYVFEEWDHRVAFQLTEEGAKIYENVTAMSIGRTITIMMDGEVLIAPTVQAAIQGGAGVINGLESEESARRIAAQIQSGTLPLDLVQDRVEIWADYEPAGAESSGNTEGE